MRAPGSAELPLLERRAIFRKGVVVRPFSKARWRKIKEILAKRRVDLDTQMVGVFALGKQPWRLLDDSAARQQALRDTLDSAGRQQSLRDALQILAWYYDGTIFWREPLTPAQVAERWEKTLRAFEAACSMQERMAIDNDYYSGDENLEDSAVFEHVARLRKRIAKLRAMRSPRFENAHTRHNDYWRELTRLWLGITGNAGPLRRKALAGFLLACTPPTMFPDMTAQALRQKIDGFISNRSRQKSPHSPKPRGA
jgi:hypothetical protein